MGAWDVGSFENDDALDWVYVLEKESGFTVLADPLENIIDQKDDYPETLDCAVAVSAAEVVSALMGTADDDLPDEVIEWVEDKPEPSEELVDLAISALDVIMANSELKDLWQESDSYKEWRSSMRDLHARLQTD